VSGILVTACICRRTPFSHLLRLTREHGWGLDDLVRETGGGGQCGLCRPYLGRMLATGQTEFHQLIRDPDAG
jgi:bacterioferritin-associated ferredoxin